MCDIRSAGLAAHFDPKGKPPPGLVTDPIQAAKWVDDQVQNGSGYIKIIIDQPDVDPQTLKALVDAAHAQGLQTISHCVWQGAYKAVINAGVDMITHTPLGEVLDDSVVRAMQTKKIPAIPTLIMVRSILRRRRRRVPNLRQRTTKTPKRTSPS
jgi:imidazolonepropionase-like amidohydrolase